MNSKDRLHALAMLDGLYAERKRLNEVIYHIRRYVLGTNYKKGHTRLADQAMAFARQRGLSKN